MSLTIFSVSLSALILPILFLRTEGEVSYLSLKRTVGRVYFPDWSQQVHVHCSPCVHEDFIKTNELSKPSHGTLNTHDHTTTLNSPHLSVYYSIMHIAHIGFGTPPQIFRAVVDISWADTYVPSTKCLLTPHEARYCMYHNLYSSNKSSTYQHVPSTSKAQVLHNGVYAWGKLSQDTMSIGNISIVDQVFDEALQWRPGYGVDFGEGFDSVLGLSRLHPNPNVTDSNLNASGPLTKMLSQGALDRNIYSLKLARAPGDIGELILGGVDDKYQENLTVLPLTNLSSNRRNLYTYYASTGWQVAGSYFSLGTPSDIHREPLTFSIEGWLVALTNSQVNIVLPLRYTLQIIEYLGLEDREILPDFPCDALENFPNLTIALGPGSYQFQLTPQQYMYQVIDPVGEWRCILPFISLASVEKDPDYLLLGGAFMENFYAEYDLDNHTIALAPRYDQ